MTPTWDDLHESPQPLGHGDGAAQAWRLDQQAEAAMNVLYHQINEARAQADHDGVEAVSERFSPSICSCATGARALGYPQSVLDADSRADGDGRPRAADRLRERRESAARSRRRAAEGGRDPAGARRRRGAIVRQRLIESLLLACGRRAARHLAFAWWTGTLLSRCCRSTTAPARLCRRTGHARHRVRDRRGVGHGAALRPCACLQSTRPALTSTLKDEAGSVVGGTGHARFRKGAGRRAGRSLGAAARRRGTVRAKPLQPEDAEPRLRGRQAARLLGQPVAQRLLARARDRVCSSSCRNSSRSCRTCDRRPRR